ncbi:hypothetical protein VHEMI04517 [[Torrubiella] hemipterigena]|uniref:Uncharacterized protein n=1 Tax=[Torrubiella] hemipterigena TaxID=1531966 RepID=A0A0A1T1J3_9HYPO|nr:hypothetical protein VHEMI04517 [[Torrubiella] hemipterigena]
MDPLSISFGVAGVLPLIAKVITTLRRYAAAVAGAKKKIESFILELEVLQVALKNLEDLLQDKLVSEADIVFDPASVLLSCSTTIQVRLQEILKKLISESDKKLGCVLWPFTEKEQQKAINEVRNFSTWVQFALSVDGCRLLSQTSENVLAILAQQLEQFSMVHQLETRTKVLCSAIQEQTNLLRNSAEEEHRNAILDWISATRYNTRHSILQRTRAKNTGSWLLQNKLFLQWKEGIASSRVLWCNGIQGSGKTTLASIAIDELQHNHMNSNTHLAYYYFDHQDHELQSPLMVMSCILRQLLEQLQELPPSVKMLYDARSDTDSRQIQKFRTLLEEIAESCGAIYIVLDALDECSHTTYMLELIDRLNQIAGCHLLIMSRPYIYNRLPKSHSYLELTIEAQEEDIQQYIQQHCDSVDIYQVADQEFVNQLIDKLAHSASGMFLLPVLQLRTVLNEPTIGEMEDKLNALTNLLSDAFEETLNRITRLPASRNRLALSSLMHLAHAKRFFKSSELSDILALRPDSTSLNPRYRPTTAMILDCCQGLVALDDETDQLRLAHYSIQEYLVSRSEFLFPQFEVNLASTCLQYLLLDDFKSGALENDKDIESRLSAYPFLLYVSMFWGKYIHPVETEPSIWSRLFEFFGSPSALAVSAQILYYQKGYHVGYYGFDESVSWTALHQAAANNLEHATKALLEKVDVNAATVMGSTPVIRAASSGHVAVMELLLQRGANPRMSNWYGNALHCAAEAGQCDTIRHLVRWGMDPSCEGRRRSPLSCTLDHDHAEAFELLVDLGADMHLSDKDWFENAFLEACHRGCERTVDMMLKRGWINKHEPNQTVSALHEAGPSMLRHLVDIGFDINAVDIHGNSALSLARKDCDESRISILRDAGAFRR